MYMFGGSGPCALARLSGEAQTKRAESQPSKGALALDNHKTEGDL